MINALSLDIGGTKIAAAIVGEDGLVRHVATMPTPVIGGAAAVLQAAAELGGRVRAAAQAANLDISAVGAGVAGLVDQARGVVTYASEALPGWTGAAVAQELEQAFDQPVTVDNDVNTLALGEQYFGAGRRYAHVLYVAVGTGLGGAIVQHGRLWRGATFSAGEIGHLLIDLDGKRRCHCGQPGHLAAYAAGPALVAQYRELSGRESPNDLRLVAERARSGDTLAWQIIANGGRTLGKALAGLICTLDPQAVVLGGGVAELGDEWWGPLISALRAGPLPGPAAVAIRRAELGLQAGLVGAAWLALNAKDRARETPAER